MSSKEIELALKELRKQGKKPLTKEEKEENIRHWITFFRRNLEYFNRDILGLKLKDFQNDMIREMSEGEIVDIVASRGLSKSYTLSVYAYDMALLYSNQEILLTSETYGQANNIIREKMMKELASKNGQSEFLKQLVADDYIEFSNDKETGGMVVTFGNGSVVRSMGLGEAIRSKRSTIMVGDEAVRLKKTDIDQIAEPTLRPRQFIGRPSDYREEPKQIYLTSAKSKTSWVWRHLKQCVEGRFKCDNTRYRFYNGDIYTAVASGIQTPKQLEARRKANDPLSFQMEYLNIFISESESSMFDLKDFEENQNNETCFKMRTPYEVVDGKDNPYPYNSDEIRIVVCDVAMSATTDANHDNDNTILGFIAIDTTRGIKRLDGIASFNGTNATEQAVFMKRAFYEYKATYFAIDTRGVGLPMVDFLGEETIDSEYGETYPVWNVNRDKKIAMCSDAVLQEKLARQINEGVEVIIPIVATSQSNHEMHIGLRQALKDHSISFLKDPSDMQAIIEDKDPTFVTLSAERKSEYLMPYMETRFMINEAISLETKFLESGLIKLKENRGALKDRYIITAYGNQLADKILLKDAQDEEQTFDESDWSFIAGDYSNFESSFGGYSW